MSAIALEASDPGGFDTFRALTFAATVADPLRKDVPLVVCTQGFTTLTGYPEKEVVGRSCLFLLEKVPATLIDKEDENKCQAFLEQCRTAAVTGAGLAHRPAGDGARRPWAQLGHSEVLCVQLHAKKTGELFRGMFHMKSVQLDEQPYVLTLLTSVRVYAPVMSPAEPGAGASSEKAGSSGKDKGKSGKKGQEEGAGGGAGRRRGGGGRRGGGAGGDDEDGNEEDGGGDKNERKEVQDGLFSSSSSDSVWKAKARDERKKRTARRKKRNQRAEAALGEAEEEEEALEETYGDVQAKEAMKKPVQQKPEKDAAKDKEAPTAKEISNQLENDEPLCAQEYGKLNKGLAQVELVLARSFWYSGPMRRQGSVQSVLPQGLGVGGRLMLNQVRSHRAVLDSLTQTPSQSVGSVPKPFGGYSINQAAEVEEEFSGGVALGSRSLSSVGKLQPKETVSSINDAKADPSMLGDFNWSKQLSSSSDASTAFPESIWSKQVSYESQLSMDGGNECLTVEEEDEGELASDDLDWSPHGAQAPEDLESGFSLAEVQPWEEGKYQLVHKLQDAMRNQGTVSLMREVATDRMVAVKHMPNSWVKSSHQAFLDAHPEESEHPWKDIGCTAFLDKVGFPHSVGLLGVYRSDEYTSTVSNFADQGDLFSWAQSLEVPFGASREELVKPIARQLAKGILHLHNMSIMHRDLSLENVLIHRMEDDSMRVKVIDYGVALTQRHFDNDPVGKPSYRAPEVFEEDGLCDAFLVDAFAFGVILFSLCLMDYPWMDTENSGDRCFRYIQTKGFHAFLTRRKVVNNAKKKLSEVVSQELEAVLAGLLEFDPSRRLTLGEDAWSKQSRRSIWDEPWFR